MADNGKLMEAPVSKPARRVVMWNTWLDGRKAVVVAAPGDSFVTLELSRINNGASSGRRKRTIPDRFSTPFQAIDYAHTDLAWKGW